MTSSTLSSSFYFLDSEQQEMRDPLPHDEIGMGTRDWNPIVVPHWDHFQATENNVISGKENSLLVSNPSVPLPEGIWFQRDFVGEQEERDIIREIGGADFRWEGFDNRRRVQRYRFETTLNDGNGNDQCSTPPLSLVRLRERLENVLNLKAMHVAVEEYSVGSKRATSGEYNLHQEVSSFESVAVCSCATCSCFVAQIPLRKAATQLFNKPKNRQVTCWGLESPDHWTDVLMDRGSLLVKSKDFLWNWRSRTKASPECSESVYILRFYTLPEEHNGSLEHEVFGYVPSKHDEYLSPDLPIPPLEDLLTIIITTSPIKSNPSTEVLEKAMETFVNGGSEFAFKCRKVIVCDGVRTNDTEGHRVTRKHSNVKQAMRNGIVTSDQGESYKQYKRNLQRLCENATETSPFYNAVVEELEERQGYGYALRHALRHCVSTQFVCVVQHDRTFMRATPVRETVEAMFRHPNIKYVGMSMRSNLMYRDIFIGKYGAVYQDELRELILRPPELQIDRTLYGPGSKSTERINYFTEKLRKNILALAETYRGSNQLAIEQAWTESVSVPLHKHQLSLTPTLFWYDNVHICETKHYRDFIFDPMYKMVAKGGFVEDKLSPVIKRTVDRMGLAEGHSRFGCYLLDDHSGFFFTGHLDGGSYMTTEERASLREEKTFHAKKGQKNNQP